MIVGVVTAEREAVIGVRVRARDGREHELEVVIDTGFNGFLALPPSTISRLGLAFAGPTNAILGDGSGAQLSVYEAVVVLDGREVDVELLAVDSGPLAGMSLLYGFDLRMEVMEGGRVTLERMR